MNRKRLTVRFVATAPPGKHGDNLHGLFLLVKPSGARSWVQRLTIRGRRSDLGLGSCDFVSLAEARDAAYENRRLARTGGDPLAERRKARMPTFREATMATFAAHRSEWTNARVAGDWLKRVDHYAFAKLGALPVDSVTQADILGVLSPVIAEKPSTGSKLKSAMSMVFAWAMAHGHVERNPVAAAKGALPKRRAKVESHRALPYSGVPALISAVSHTRSKATVKLAFRFAVLTAARSGEARGAMWSEIDLERREWRIPGERMKRGIEHRVPLSDAAMDVLSEARALGNGPLVFPPPRGGDKPMVDVALMRLIASAGYGERTTMHGLRSAFRDWAAEATDADHAVMELSLAHSVGGATERAYARSDLIAKRRSLMESWGAFVTQSGKVAQLRTTA